jgi:D-alanyl-lipoteichoic acid acyltransferase DltB (MBOAT superfamily)
MIGAAQGAVKTVLFNSYIFVFAFLPVVLWGFALFRHFGRAAQIAWLAVASLLFYAWWSVPFTGLLILSMLFNFMMGRIIQRGTSIRFATLCFAVTCNISLLCFFKYWNFFSANLVAATGMSTHAVDTMLPLGISFYTFTQIAYLVDSYRREVKPAPLLQHLLFVSYFPHLIAGPLFHNRQMMPQFASAALMRLNAENISIGLTLFVMGLFKKVMIADNVAPMADRIFAAPRLTLLDSWIGVIAYTMQIYFDFSGYSDMAIGLSKMFNIDLPINFNSPYKAASIIDFWRRWHMTLSQFLRDYLYIPLGGNRNGPARRYINLMITMLLGGLWHGANWTFVAWGGLHGLFLVANSAWRHFNLVRIHPILAVLLTLACVEAAWVFFRADNIESAVRILHAMAGLNGLELPPNWIARSDVLRSILARVHIVPANMDATFHGFRDILILSGLTASVWLLPNSQQIVGLVKTVPSRVSWQPSLTWALGVGAIAFVCVLRLGEPSRFLYYQF